MSEGKHTAGRWALSDRGTAVIRTADQQRRIAYVEPADASEDEQWANARLIAAAPDMVEASSPFAAYGEILRGQRVADDSVVVELFDCKITVGDFLRIAAVVAKAKGSAA